MKKNSEKLNVYVPKEISLIILEFIMKYINVSINIDDYELVGLTLDFDKK